MTQLAHADIFFLVTTIVTVIVSLFIIILLYYSIRLIRHLSRLAEKIENEADEYVELSSNFRSRFAQHPIVQFLTGGSRSNKAKPITNVNNPAPASSLLVNELSPSKYSIVKTTIDLRINPTICEVKLAVMWLGDLFTKRNLIFR